VSHLTAWGFHTLGLLVVITGWIVVFMATLHALLWLADVLLTKVLRMTGAFKLVLRYAWLDGNKKQQLKDDLAEEERRREIPYVPPVDDEDEAEGDPVDVVIREPKESVLGCECAACGGYCGRRPAGRTYHVGEPRRIGQVLCAHCETPGHRHFNDSQTPAGPGSDSDMYPGAPGSQSCESGESKARQGEGTHPLHRVHQLDPERRLAVILLSIDGIDPAERPEAQLLLARHCLQKLSVEQRQAVLDQLGAPPYQGQPE
jgi:hypothetical protein